VCLRDQSPDRILRVSQSISKRHKSGINLSEGRQQSSSDLGNLFHRFFHSVAALRDIAAEVLDQFLAALAGVDASAVKRQLAACERGWPA